jgi:hypothetical protein
VVGIEPTESEQSERVGSRSEGTYRSLLRACMNGGGVSRYSHLSHFALGDKAIPIFPSRNQHA